MKKPINPFWCFCLIITCSALWVCVVCFMISFFGVRDNKRSEMEEQTQKGEIEQYHMAEGRSVKFIEEITPN